jgi:ribosomal-protein-alanine N-acetyltransferase
MERVTAPAGAVTRRMTRGDVERVVAIEAASFASPWSEATFRGLLEREGLELWVLERAEAGVVGYAVVWCILDQGELANIAIAPGHRGAGLGSMLLGKVLDEARARGVRSMYLEVRESNSGAAALYRRFGFEQIGIRPRYYESPVEDALLMVARL